MVFYDGNTVNGRYFGLLLCYFRETLLLGITKGIISGLLVSVSQYGEKRRPYVTDCKLETKTALPMKPQGTIIPTTNP